MDLRRVIRWKSLLLAVTLAFTIAYAGQARAGGGPENVFVVVNSNSWASQTIANYFVYLRAIPSSNVMLLPWEGQLDEPLSVDDFRKQIIEAILKEIAARGLKDQIDCIAYSSDFPYEIDARPDLQNATVPPELLPGSSLTSLTYLSQFVVARKPYYLLLDSNRYAAIPPRGEPTPNSQAFSAATVYPPTNTSRSRDKLSYLMSTMLAVTSGRGTSLNEATNDLVRSYQADGTHPKGTIYFVRNNDPRSTTRSPRFQAAIDDLTKLGIKSEIINGTLPIRKNDVMGLTTGASTFDWSTCGSTILPGAICDNFTSTGGRLRENGSQTSMAEFLRYGASGSCGTVMEPRTIELKIPLPSIHVHYARGCTLAESFYQSVGGPYQLLIVGDPLCRPWANIARVGVKGLKLNDKVKGSVELEPYVIPPQSTTAATASKVDDEGQSDATDAAPQYSVERFELFVDGKRLAQCKPGEKLAWDTTTTNDGFHEVRIVSIESGAIATQSRCGVPCLVANQDFACELKSSAEKALKRGEHLQLEASCPGATQIDFYSVGGVLLGNSSGERASIEVDTTTLGLGPVHIWAIAHHDGAPQKIVASAPVRVDVEAPSDMPAIEPPAGAMFAAGVLLTPEGATPKVVKDTLDADWLASHGVKASTKFTLEGYCDVPSKALYQLQVGFVGKLIIKVDDKVVLDNTTTRAFPLQMVPFSLAKGLHHLTVEGECGNTARLELRFGTVGTRRVGERMFTHLQTSPVATK